MGEIYLRAWLFKAELRDPRVSARFEFRFESLESISGVILFVYKLMIESSFAKCYLRGNVKNDEMVSLK